MVLLKENNVIVWFVEISGMTLPQASMTNSAEMQPWSLAAIYDLEPVDIVFKDTVK